MKKIIALVLVLCFLPTFGAYAETEILSGKEIDEFVKEDLEEYIIKTDYDDEYYGAIMTFDGAYKNWLKETDAWDELCDMIDELTEKLYEKVDEEFIIMFVIVSEKDNDDILYISANGLDVTDYLKNK